MLESWDWGLQDGRDGWKRNSGRLTVGDGWKRSNGWLTDGDGWKRTGGWLTVGDGRKRNRGWLTVESGGIIEWACWLRGRWTDRLTTGESRANERARGRWSSGLAGRVQRVGAGIATWWTGGAVMAGSTVTWKAASAGGAPTDTSTSETLSRPVTSAAAMVRVRTKF